MASSKASTKAPSKTTAKTTTKPPVKAVATAIPAARLAAAIDRAVKVSAAKLQVDVLSPNVIHKWDLVGRVVRDLDVAHRFATDVTAQLKTAGVKADPATFIINKQIIAGFIERGRLMDGLREL